MPKTTSKPRKLKEIMDNIPRLQNEYGDEIKTQLFNYEHSESGLYSLEIPLPIVFHSPRLTKSPDNIIIELDIGEPGKPIPPEITGAKNGEKFTETEESSNNRMQQIAAYLFEMALAGVTQFSLEGINDPKLRAVFEDQFNSLCVAHNNENPDNPITSLFSEQLDSDRMIYKVECISGKHILEADDTKPTRSPTNAATPPEPTSAAKPEPTPTSKPAPHPPEPVIRKFQSDLNKYKDDAGKINIEQQANDIWNAEIQKHLEGKPPKKVAIFYAANNDQAEALLQGYTDRNVPRIDGIGQAPLFNAIGKKINGLQESDRDNVHIIPIPTSIAGGNNVVAGQVYKQDGKDITATSDNFVSLETMQKYLANVAWHMANGYEIIGLQRAKKPGPGAEFSIGGGASQNWTAKDFIQIVEYADGTFALQVKRPPNDAGKWDPPDPAGKTVKRELSQNEYLQEQLDILSNKPFDNWPAYLQNAYVPSSPEKKTTVTVTNDAEKQDLSELNQYIVAAGKRSIAAKNFAQMHNWKIHQHNGRSFLHVTDPDDKKTLQQYEIMSGSVTNFRQGKFVSTGSGMGREIIIFDADSPLLKEKYDELKIRIEQFKATNGGREPSLEDVMKIVMRFIRETLGKVDKDNNRIPNLGRLTEQFINNRTNDPSQAEYNDHPLIELDEFIRNKTGVCRHHGLVLANFLDNLQHDGIIPKGRVHHARDNIDGGAHVWVMYQPDAPINGKDQLYLADSLWNNFGDILDPKTAEEYKKQGYDNAISNCEKRFNRPAVAPTPPAADSTPSTTPTVDPTPNPIPSPPPPPAEEGGKLTPAASKPTSTGRTNFTSNMNAIKTALQNSPYSTWTIDDSNKLRQVVSDENKQPRFIITPAEIKTDKNDIDTFKAMLICFKAANPGKMPNVTAFSEAGKTLWEAAVKEIYKDELASGKNIEVNVSPPLPPPPSKVKTDPAAMMPVDEEASPTPKH